jgi:hypothetical protein
MFWGEGFNIALLWSSLSSYLCCWFGGLLAGLHASSLIEGSCSVEDPVPLYRDIHICHVRVRFCGTAFSRGFTATVWCWLVLACVFHFLLL